MESLQVIELGEARVALINTGDLTLDMADALRLTPDEQPADYAEAFAAPAQVAVNCIYIGLPGLSVLVDAAMYEADSSFAIPGYTPPPDLVAQLAQIGVAAQDIDHIIISHLHFDHFNGLTHKQNDEYVPSFPNAVVHIGQGDWLAAQPKMATAGSLEARTLGVIHKQGRVHPVNGDYALGDAVQILPSPGETPGHQTVKLRAGGQTLYCIGDLYHHIVEIAYPQWGVHWADLPTMQASRAQFVEAALAEDAIVIVSHVHGAGKMVEVDGGVRWRTLERGA